MPIVIVSIAEEHIEGFRACLDVVSREEKYLAQIEAPSVERVREFVRKGIDDGVAQFVALDDGVVIGWCDIFPDWAHAVRHRGSVGMGVLPDYRGRGVGTRLLTACIDTARAAGLTRIELEVRADNERAIALYERLGFAVDGRKRDGLRYHGVPYESLTMSLVFEQRDA